MRVVFMGTPTFAVPTLESLAENHEVVAVYTRPDAASGRGRAVRPSAVKEAALSAGLPVVQPSSLKAPEVVEALASLTPDVLVVAAYGAILPQTVLDVAVHGAINVHASLLPRWRGAAPIQRAILAGDELAGVSIMRMEAGLDTGPYCSQASVTIGEADSDDLSHQLAMLGARELTACLAKLGSPELTWVEQDESLVTYAEKISKGDVLIEPEMSAPDALRRVRASSDAAPCRISITGRPVTVLSARMIETPVDHDLAAPGAVRASKEGLVISLQGGSLLLERIKPDGKRSMAAADWARGLQQGSSLTWTGA
ncbi:MAG: methionyl-tRNA formyltransferase [Coriobacteriia bacterium]|nr:methionyl-tRNA formyltransferase [Coriobacteriia bacterium]